MADKPTTPEAPGGRRKRAAPTIELTATEVTPAEAPGAPDPQHEPPSAEAAPPPAAEPPPPEQPASAATQEPSSEVAPEPPPRAARPRTYLIALAGGFVGAAIMTGVLAGLWYAGLLLPSNDQSAQIAALQSQVQALQNRPAPADRNAIDALQARVQQLAREIATLPPGDKTVAERLVATDNALKSLGIALAALNHRNDDIASEAKQARERADAAEKAVSALRASLQDIAKNAAGGVPAAALDALQTRVAALERSVQAARSEIAKNSTTDRVARLALSAAALRDAVERGAPFAAELAQAKSLGADGKMLAPLAPFAQGGVPSKSVLARALTALKPAMLKAAGNATAPGGFLDRLQANASRLVRIEPVEAPRGDATSDVLARIEVEAAKAEIDGVLADLAKLPPAVRAPAQAWIAQVKARAAALSAAGQFAAETARVLAKPASAGALSKP